jgi:hypothetical protein
VGQELNKQNGQELPIYGCYIVGGAWRFLLLEGKKYAISHLYDATDYTDACQILTILFQLKAHCMLHTSDTTDVKI